MGARSDGKSRSNSAEILLRLAVMNHIAMEVRSYAWSEIDSASATKRACTRAWQRCQTRSSGLLRLKRPASMLRRSRFLSTTGSPSVSGELAAPYPTCTCTHFRTFRLRKGQGLENTGLAASPQAWALAVMGNVCPIGNPAALALLCRHKAMHKRLATRPKSVCSTFTTESTGCLSDAGEVGSTSPHLRMEVFAGRD